ncbi:WD40/YVTN/BNR-like repeat-containing protein [Sphingobacterium mizutaii]|uniref:WD40/YVTN/BNR-like repeat-containing protein n=1 Tax=Sphingobacterium mizutaii TaxID=1010 RepID=UPI003D994B0D
MKIMLTINWAFKTFLMSFLTLSFCTSCKAQVKENYIAIDQVPELTEKDNYQFDIPFNPSKIKNAANGTEADILYQNDDLNFSFFNDVLFLTPQKGLIVGGTNLSIRSTKDEGKSWQALDFSRFANAFHSIAKTKDHIFVLGESKYIFRADHDFGKWEVFNSQTLYPNATGITWFKLRFLNDNFGVAVGQRKDNGRPIMLLTKDTGSSWETINLEGSILKDYALVEVSMLDQENWLILDDTIGISYFTADAGKTWQDISSKMLYDADATIRSLWLVNPNELFAAGSRSFWKSSDFAKDWTRLDFPKPFNPIEMYNEGDYLTLTDITGIGEDIYVTSTASDNDEGRTAFAYRLDRENMELKPLLLSDSSTFIGESHAIYALDKEHIYIVDRDKLYRVQDK